MNEADAEYKNINWSLSLWFNDRSGNTFPLLLRVSAENGSMESDLTREQMTELRDTLTAWLDGKPLDEENE